MASQLYSKKTIEKMGSQLKEMSGSKISSFAMRQMEKMGWTEGKGLGKNNDGRAIHVKAVKKDDTDGLGVSAAMKNGADMPGQDQWWFDSPANPRSQLQAL